MKQRINFPFFISKRYVLARRSLTAINITAIISMLGVAVGSMALVVVLSVFNGFDVLIKSLFNSFDPDIKITAVEGKTFVPDSLVFLKVKSIEGVRELATVVEENALIQYRDKQYIANIKGVSSSFVRVSGIEKRITEGKFELYHGTMPYAVIGQGVAYYLGVGMGLSEALAIYVPRRTSENPQDAYSKKYIIPSGVFSIEQDFDSKYVIVPIEFARSLLEYTNEVTAIEIKIDSSANVSAIQNQIETYLGEKYSVKNRYQQQEFFYKIMKSEKWAIFFILTFIIIVASLNIIGSLTMVILDKKKDIGIYNFLGANWKTIRKIFIYDGWMISLVGAIIGILMGLLLCWLQSK